MHNILIPIIEPLTNLRNKDVDTCFQTQIDYVKRTCAVDVPTSQITKHFPTDANYPLNKWFTSSLDECVKMLNNHDIWVLMGVYSQ